MSWVRSPDKAATELGGRTFWSASLDELLAATAATTEGLSPEEAARRLAADGPNTIEVAQALRGLRLFLAQFRSPIVLILVAATALSMALGDVTDGSIILVIVAASGALGFWQEHTAGQAVDALLAQVRVEAEVLRGGREISVSVGDMVVGDVLVLGAGDVVPADCRVIESHRLLVDEAVLTGESYPAEKSPGVVMTATPLAGRSNSLFMGTHVVSGAGEAVVAATSRSTEFGAVSARLAARGVTTGFERGITAFGLLLVRAMVVLVTAIFVINLMLDRPFVDSLLFSLALAVGLTPQLLPAIVSISLSTGARRMAAEKVIVKRLDAIEDLGAMTVLCTDKTGTITAGAIRIDGAFDLTGRASEEVLRLAALNAGLQRGFPNPLDQAILADAAPIDPGTRLDEIPYDFHRKRLSVLVEDHGAALLVTKGAFSKVLEVCAAADIGGRTVPLEEARADLEDRFAALSAEGYRVLALATRSLAEAHVAGEADETDMTLRGLLAFHDPPKPGAAEAIRQLESRGVPVRLVTGDNRLAAGKVAADVGLDARRLLTGDDIDHLDDTALAELAADTIVFAEVDPLHKERIVGALRANRHVVGFLGDGINDAAALHAADVGISVNMAVDVAKQSAAIILLDKSLAVVADGVRLGRQTFANTLKYIRGGSRCVPAVPPHAPPPDPAAQLPLRHPRHGHRRGFGGFRTTRATPRIELAIHPQLHDRLRAHQLGVRRRHLRHPPLGGRCERRPVPKRLVHRINDHRARRDARPAHQPTLLPQPAGPSPPPGLDCHRRHHHRSALHPARRAPRPDRRPGRDPGRSHRTHRCLCRRQRAGQATLPTGPLTRAPPRHR